MCLQPPPTSQHQIPPPTPVPHQQQQQHRNNSDEVSTSSFPRLPLLALIINQISIPASTQQQQYSSSNITQQQQHNPTTATEWVHLSPLLLLLVFTITIIIYTAAGQQSSDHNCQSTPARPRRMVSVIFSGHCTESLLPSRANLPIITRFDDVLKVSFSKLSSVLSLGNAAMFYGHSALYAGE
ncbi:hypothetical protein CF335_g5700 [Tilletia laevis]|nr:hypothetical protein CF335_g5700 [Tilletia laevis]